MATMETVAKDNNTKLSNSQLMATETLYLLSAKNDGFRVVGPWHSVDPKYLDYLVDKLAQPVIRPCSRGHSKGAWASEDKAYRDYTRPKTSYELFKEKREANSGRSSVRSGYSLPGYGMPQNRDTRQGAVSRSLNSRASNDRNMASPNSSVTISELDSIVNRMTRHTVASRGGVDIAEKFANKDKVYGSQMVSPEAVDHIVNRVTRPTKAYLNRDEHGGYTRPDSVIGGRTVYNDALEDINSRLTKPTIASQGGAPIANKDFTYSEPVTKSNPRIPGIQDKRKKRMTKKVTDEELKSITGRLNKLTPAYKAKYSLSPHVWVDTSKTGPAFQNQMTIA